MTENRESDRRLLAHETVDRLRRHACRTSFRVRLIARWVIGAPELEAKILLGRHLHDEARAATAFADRLAELAVDFDLGTGWLLADEPALFASAFADDTAELVRRLYGYEKERDLAEARRHLEQLSPLSDEPTARVVEEYTRTLERQIGEARATYALLREEFPQTFSASFGQPSPRARTEVSPQALSERLRSPATPNRDPRFRLDAPMPDPLVNSDEHAALLALLHLNLTDLEIATIEACSRLLLDFPEMPWEFVCDMARQCWDEARHAEAFRRHILELGGALGAFRVAHTLWEMATDQPIEVRIALHQLIGEWTGVDGALYYMEKFKGRGFVGTSSLFEFVALDEINHVAFGNKWIRFISRTDDAVADSHRRAEQRRVAFGKKVGGPPTFPFHRWACERAGFAQTEIDQLEQRHRTEGSIFR